MSTDDCPRGSWVPTQRCCQTRRSPLSRRHHRTRRSWRLLNLQNPPQYLLARLQAGICSRCSVPQQMTTHPVRWFLPTMQLPKRLGLFKRVPALLGRSVRPPDHHGVRR